MPIQIQIKEDGAWPIVICDQCGQEIEDAKNGNYEWKVDEHGKPVADHIYFTHKQCCRTFEHTHGRGLDWLAMPLECLPVYLVKRLGIKWEKSVEKTAMLSSIR